MALQTAGWGQGTLSGGIIGAVTKLAIFVVAPLLCIEVLISMAQGNPSASAAAFISALQQMVPGVVSLGAIICLTAGLANYHLRRTRARLLLGLLTMGLAIIYAYVLFMGGPFAAAIGALGWRLPAFLVFGAATYMAVASALHFYRDYEYFNEKRGGPGGSANTYRPELGWGEFDLEVGDPVPGAASAERYIKGTVIPPVLVLLVLAAALSAIGFGGSPAERTFLNVLDGMAALFLVWGLPLVSLAFLKGYYPKGTRSRALYDLANSALLILLIYWIFVGSGLDQYVSEGGGLIVQAYPMVVAIVIWTFLDFLTIGIEYRDERDKWLSSVGYATSPGKEPRLRYPLGSKYYDFNLALGSRGRGLKGAKKEVLRFIILPEIMILVVIGLQRSMHLVSTDYGIMGNLAVMVLLGGLLVTFVAFWRSFFPPGSRSRLALGLLSAPAIGLFFLGLGLGGGLVPGLKQIGILLYMPGIELLVIILVLLVGFRQVAEYADSRRDWLLACGREVHTYSSIKNMNRLQEFRIRFASKHDGAIWAGKGMVRYVFYTSILIIFIITAIDSVVYAGTGLELKVVSETLGHKFLGLILIAIPLAATRAFYGFYPQGSTSKLTAGYTMCLIGAAYTYTSFSGGSFTMMSDGETMTAGVFIDFTFIVILFTIGWFLWGLTVTAEYCAYRKAWVANDYRPVQYRKEEQQRAAVEKLIAQERTRSAQLSEREQRRAARRARRRGTTVAEEEVREMAAKEAGVLVHEENEVAAEEERVEAEDLEKDEEEDDSSETV